jgi:hypothetical protein
MGNGPQVRACPNGMTSLDDSGGPAGGYPECRSGRSNYREQRPTTDLLKSGQSNLPNITLPSSTRRASNALIAGPQSSGHTWLYFPLPSSSGCA